MQDNVDYDSDLFNSGNLERLAANVKEDFNRLNLDQVKYKYLSGFPREIILLLIHYFNYLHGIPTLLLFPAQEEELRFSPIIFSSPQHGKKIQAG